MASDDKVYALLGTLSWRDEPIDEALASLIFAGARAQSTDEYLLQLWLKRDELPAAVTDRFLDDAVVERLIEKAPSIASSSELAASPRRRPLLEALAARAEAGADISYQVGLGALHEPVIVPVFVRMASIAPTKLLESVHLAELAEEVGDELASLLVARCLDPSYGTHLGATVPLGNPERYRLTMEVLAYLVRQGRFEDAGQLCGQEAAVEALVATDSLCSPALLEASADPGFPERLVAYAASKDRWSAILGLARRAGPDYADRLWAALPWDAPAPLEESDRTDHLKVLVNALERAAARLGTDPVRSEMFWELATTWGGTFGGLVEAVLGVETRPVPFAA